jgi:hypothetical protein
MNQMTTTTNNTNTTEYFKCNICNYKFAFLSLRQMTLILFDIEYLNLLSDMRAHVDKHRQERPNHKRPPTMLLNLFTSSR